MTCVHTSTHLISWIALVAVCSSCASSGEISKGESKSQQRSAPAQEQDEGRETPGDTTASDKKPAETAQRTAEKVDEEPESDSLESRRPQNVRLDLDGDGDEDKVERQVVGDSGRVILKVDFADGRVVRLGAKGGPSIVMRFYREPDEEPHDSGFSWMKYWKPVEKQGEYYPYNVGLSTVRFHLPDAKGDALYMSSTDVGTMLILTDDGWVIMHLGF